MQLVLLFTLLFCALLVEGYDEEMRPCYTPSWEGRATAWDGGKGTRTDFWISYDKDNRRKRVLTQTYKPRKQSVELILLYDKNAFFKIDRQTMRCESLTKPPVSWQYLQIPPNATFSSQSRYGSQENGVLTSKWKSLIYTEDILYTVPDEWIGIYTVPDCVPFRQIISRGITHSIVTSFTNITLDIQDSSVFVPPIYCPEVQLRTQPTFD